MRRKLTFQPLEPRLLLSADLAPVEGVLEVIGTNETDFAFITARQDRLLVELNGQAFDFALEEVKEIRVDLLGGDDTLRLDAGVALPAVQIDLGEGDNRFEADLLNPVGALSVVAGSGSDTMITHARWDGASVDDHPDFAWVPTYNPGAGDDGVHAGLSTAESFVLGDGSVRVDARILAGDGNDAISFDLSQLLVGATRAPLIQIDLDGGAGNDLLKVTMPVASQGGDGEEPIDPAERRAPVSVRYDSRAGTDAFELIGGDAAERYGIRAFDDPDLGRSFGFAASDIGTANPLVEAAVITVTHVGVHTGAGDDLLQGRILLDADWNVELGDGDDVTDIETLIGDVFAEAQYRVDAGEGDNETSLRFGDGERGARLPSGETNVRVEYRSGSGNDRVSFDWLAHLDRPLAVGLDVLTGAGDDLAITRWEQQHEFRTGKVAQLDYNFDTGAGDDVVEVRVAPGEGIEALGAEVKVTSVDDPDELGRVKVQFPFEQGGLGEAHVTGAEKLRLETGSGDDRVMVEDVTGALRAMRLDVATGAGDDELQYVPVGRVAQYLEESLGEGLQWAVFDGGDGNDRFALATSDRAELIEIEGVEVADVPDPLVRVTDLATSLGTLQASVLATESISVDSAGGDDAVMAKYTLFLPDGTPLRARVDLEVRTGEGNDSVRVGVLGGDDVAIDVDTQGGNDSIWIDLGHPIGESSSMDLVIDAGDDNDTVMFNPREYTLAKGATWKTRVDTGAGDDRLAVDTSNVLIGAQSRVEWLFDLGAGDDDGTHIRKNWEIDEGAAYNWAVELGEGDDRFQAAIDGQTIGDGALVGYGFSGGAGNDHIEIALANLALGAGAAFRSQVDAGGGDDVVSHELTHIVQQGGVPPPDDQKPAEFRVATGAGDDVIDFSAVMGVEPEPFSPVGLELDLQAGDGDDSVRAALLLPAVQAAANRVNVDLGDGDDTLQMDVFGQPPPDDTEPDDFKPAEFRILGGAGDDTLETRYFDVFFDIDLEMDTGDGDDFIDAVFTAPGPPGQPAGTIELDLTTGAGNDRAALLLPAVQAARDATNKVNVDLGEGDDTLQMDVLSTPPPDDTKPAEFRPAEFHILGGAGNDTVRYRYFAIIDRTTTAASSIGLFLDLGSGNDLAAIDIDTTAVAAGITPCWTIGVAGGLGSDQVGVDTRGRFDEFDLRVDLGADANEVAIEKLTLTHEGFDIQVHASHQYVAAPGSSAGGAKAVYEAGLRSDGELVQAVIEADTVGGLVADQVNVEIGVARTETVGSSLTVSVENGGGGEARGELAAAYSLGATFGGTEGAAVVGDVRFKGGTGANSLTLDLSGNDAPAHAGFRSVSGLSFEQEVVEHRAGAEVGDELTLDIAMAGVDTFSLLTGGGADRIDIDLLYPTVPVPVLTISSGDGDDAIGGTLLGVAGALKLALDTGDGDDDVHLEYTEAAALVTGAGMGGLPEVKTFSGASAVEGHSFLAYGSQFTGGVRVAVGDVNGDGVSDVVTGAGTGGGPHVKVFDGRTGAEVRSFFAFDPQFTGGVFVATGDVNGDGFADIITGADAGGGPHVKVFDGQSGAELRSFFAYAPSFTGGVRVASGDVDGDGFADIITGAGAGGGSHVKVFDGATNTEVRSFFAYAGFTGGVYVAAGDVNGDGFDDIVTGAGAGGGPHVKVFSGATNAELRSFFAYSPSFTGGVRVAVGDVNGDGVADIVTGSGPGAGPHVKVFDGATNAQIRSFFAYDPSFSGGVYVAAGDVGGDAPGTFDLALDTGAGDDAVTLQLMTGTSRSDAIAADLGTGADRFELKWHGALQEPSAEVQVLVEVALGGADTSLPEVGDEVLLSFEHGDPDRPLVLGTVWNSQDVTQDQKRLQMTLGSLDGNLQASSELTGGSGRDEVRLLYAGTLQTAAAGQIDALVDLGGGDDAAVLDFSGLTTVGPQTLAPINVDLRGGTERNTLSISGTEGNDRFTLAPHAVLLGGSANATFAGFDCVQVHALGGNDQVTMTGIDPRIDWLVDGGDGRDRFFAGFDGSFERLTLAEFELVKFKKKR